LLDLREDEKIKIILRKHWFVFLPLTVLSLFLLGIPIIGWIVIKGLNLTLDAYAIPLILGSSAFVLLVLAFFINGFIDYYLDVGFITNFRIIDIQQMGLFKRSIAEQNLIRVQDVTSRSKGIFATFLNFGDIFIQTAGEAPNFHFESIPKPTRIAQEILNLHHHTLAPEKQKDEEKETAPEKKLEGEIKF